MMLGLILGVAGSVWALGAVLVFLLTAGFPGGPSWTTMLFWPILVPIGIVRGLVQR